MPYQPDGPSRAAYSRTRSSRQQIRLSFDSIIGTTGARVLSPLPRSEGGSPGSALQGTGRNSEADPIARTGPGCPLSAAAPTSREDGHQGEDGSGFRQGTGHAELGRIEQQ